MNLTRPERYVVIACGAMIAIALIGGLYQSFSHQPHPAQATINSTGGITQAEVDSLQVGDLLCGNDGRIVAIAHVMDNGSVHYWSYDLSPAGSHICPKTNIATKFTEIYKLGTIQWKWAAEKFIIGQSQ